MTNRAAWITSPKANPFTVSDAPLPVPSPHEVIIHNHALAINPADWKMQDYDVVIKSYPAILGCDVAGEIFAVGSSVTRFKKGDRVVATADGIALGKNENMGFQLYSATNEKLVARLPENVSYEDAAVLPMGLSTAAAGLFQKETLGLQFSSLDRTPNGKAILVWGGSSSVGAGAIQLAKAAGFEVATTASKRNHEFVKELGADYVFDQASEGVVEEIVETLKKKDFVGTFDAISTIETITASVKVASALGSVGNVTTVLPWGGPTDLPDNVKISFTMWNTITTNEVWKALWGDWVTPALEKGLLKCKPNPRIVGHGLEKVQDAVDILRKGVSATKLVVTL